MIPTHFQITGGEEYLGFARQKLAALERSRLAAGAPSMTWGPCLVGSATVYLLSADDGNLISIQRAERFAGRPADTGAFDLADGTHGAVYLFDRDAAEADDNDYGNLYSPGEELSWKGPAGVLIPYDPAVNHGAAVAIDEVVGDPPFETTYYTPFSARLYHAGSALAPLAIGVQPKILCYGQAAGEIRVVIGSNYRGQANPAGGTGGFFEEIYASRGGNWVRIAYRNAGRFTLPCAFLADGRIVAHDGIYDAGGEFEAFVPNSGTRSAGAGWNRSGTVSDRLFRLPDGYPATYTVADATTDTGDSGSTTGTAPVYTPPPDPLAIVSHGVSVGDCFGTTGGTGPFTWSGSAVDAETGCITETFCGTMTVTVTDFCGNTASIDVVSPNGVWVQTSHTTYNVGPCQSGTYITCETVAGPAKTVTVLLCADSGDQPGGADSSCTYVGGTPYNNSCTHCNDWVSGLSIPASLFVVSRTTYDWRCP